MFYQGVQNFCPKKVSENLLEGVGSKAFLGYENGLIPRRTLHCIGVNKSVIQFLSK